VCPTQRRQAGLPENPQTDEGDDDDDVIDDADEGGTASEDTETT